MEPAEPNITKEESNHDTHVKETDYSSQSDIKESIRYITEPELSDEILKEISIAREQKQRGEVFSLEEVKNQLGL